MQVSSWKSESMAVYALGSQQAIHLIQEYRVVNGDGKIDMPWVAGAGHAAKVTCRAPGFLWLDFGRCREALTRKGLLTGSRSSILEQDHRVLPVWDASEL